MGGFVQDVQHAARALARNPGFTIMAIAILALGIGVNTAIFSVVNAVLLRPLPYPEPDRLVEIFLPVPGGDLRGPVSAMDFEDWREQNDVFEDIALVNTLSRGVTLTGGGEPEQLETAYVHPALFPTLAVQPAIGRALGLEDNGPGRNRVVVISHRLWARRFGADPAVTGRMVTLDGQAFTIAGVMPASCRFPEATIDVWAPESLIDAARAPRRRDNRFQRAIARIERGVTLEQARAGMNIIAARLMTQHTESNAGRATVALVPLHQAIVGEPVRAAMWILFGTAIFVLLIACANVGNLLFGRTVARRHEVGIRLALGSQPRDLLRGVIAEGVVMAVAGVIAGATFGFVMTRLASSYFLDVKMPGVLPVVLSAFVLLTAAIVASSVPAVRAARTDVMKALRAE